MPPGLRFRTFCSVKYQHKCNTVLDQRRGCLRRDSKEANGKPALFQPFSGGPLRGSTEFFQLTLTSGLLVIQEFTAIDSHKPTCRYRTELNANSQLCRPL
jgi:hypothetical protein